MKIIIKPRDSQDSTPGIKIEITKPEDVTALSGFLAQIPKTAPDDANTETPANP